MPSARLQLTPALRRVWRDGTTLQLGVDPARAVVIGGLDRVSAELVDSLDGSCDLAGLRARAVRLGARDGQVDELLALLSRAGVLDTTANAPVNHRAFAAGRSRAERDRLAPDVSAASLAHPDEGGVAVMARRRSRLVTVRGAGRVGASVVTLLAAAGVGAVVADDPHPTQPGDVAPAGATPADVGSARGDAAAAAGLRLAPSLRTTLATPAERPDLAVLAAGAGPDLVTADELLRAGVPHLFACVRDVTGVVGPLVLPGRSSCHRCHELHRTDRDPAWPRIAAQLTRSAVHPVAACDAVLATAVAAHTALQVVAYLDGDVDPSTVDGTIEIAQADGRVRRRSWSVHPSCGCTWAAALATEAS